MEHFSLEESVQTLKELLPLGGDVDPHQAAQVYLVALHLLCEIKKEQVLIQRIRESVEYDDDHLVFPDLDSIPAIRAVVHDGSLLRVLLSCLSNAKFSDPVSTESASNATIGRKRSMSLSGDPKSIKANISPVPNVRGGNDAAASQMIRQKPSFHVPTWAATVLFSAWEYFDHWPVPLVQVYAEDCFGLRLWVDHPHCQLLTTNLAFAHAKMMEEEDSAKDFRRDEASAVADTFSTFFKTQTTDDSVAAEVISSIPSTKKASLFAHRSSTSFASSSESRKRMRMSELTSRDRRVRKGRSESFSESEDSLPSSVNTATHVPTAGDDVSVSKDESSDVMDTVLSLSDRLESNGSSEISQPSAPSIQEVGLNTIHSPSMYRTSSVMSIDNQFQYPLQQKRLRSKRIRQRYFFKNLQMAQDVIVSSLSHRLDVKSKQNLSLLQCLPAFISIASVRTLVASNLEKWLQSPALAGPARSLLSSTVAHLRVVDPPLPEDLKVVDSIIRMKLKSNQLNTHIDNVKAIAKRLPFSSVINHLYSTFLSELIPLSIGPANSDQLRMIVAIHKVTEPHISYEALAAAMLMLLVHSGTVGTSASQRPQRDYLVRKLRSFIRALSSLLGNLFDGSLLVDALLSFQVNSETWSYPEDEDKARLMFQCVTLTVAPFVSDVPMTKNDVLSIQTTLHTLRKQLLSWCCTEYGPYFSSKKQLKRIDYFHSGLGQLEEGHQGKARPSWLIVMRCLLFLENPDSPNLKSFILPGEESKEDLSDWEQEILRVKVCFNFGGNVRNDLISIVLNSAPKSKGIDAEMAIQILEHLLENFGRSKNALLIVNDPDILWDMYSLVLYEPEADLSIKTGVDLLKNLPRLAYPGLWWRVTMMALVMCAKSPSKIGSVVWQDHPTLRALMKMVTSNRFKFPTVDCDESERNEMKQLDYAAREEEQRIAELLFLPPKQNPQKIEQKGARVSRRLLKQQQDKEAARELAETKRRKSLLRDAQKSIMLWDPDGATRKPPPEAVDMLYATNNLFKLSDIFQRCVDPDFVLMSIGQTSRGAIERAYDWLIPIISAIPDTISRLPSSASCFLLLRAYSTKGEEQKQLKVLSAPLRRHVQDSLRGRYGEQDAVKAFDLLMTDVASKKPDQRRCARRVLQDSLQPINSTDSNNSHSWMLAVLELEFASSLVRCAVQHMSAAAGLERGGVFRSLVMALQQYIKFAALHQIPMEQRFPDLLVLLLSTRPDVCSDALDSSQEFLALAVEVLHVEFFDYAREKTKIADPSLGATVSLCIHKILQYDGVFQVPLSLLQSICVILGIYHDQGNSEVVQPSTSLVSDLANALLHQDETFVDDSNGLASAIFVESGVIAISVESWIMLAKARSDSLARRAALSAPTLFLSRLLLCSELPRSSFITMVDRLGRLGDVSDNKNELYAQLVIPSASSEWDVGRIGSKRDVARQMLGRLSAYLRLHEITSSSNTNAPENFSTTFIFWLQNECKSTIIAETSNKAKPKKTQATSSTVFSNINSACSVLSVIRNENFIHTAEMDEELATGDFVGTTFQRPEASSPLIVNLDLVGEDAKSFMESCVRENQILVLHEFLEGFYFKMQRSSLGATRSFLDAQALDLAVNLWHIYHSSSRIQHDTCLVLHTWLPRLTRSSGNPELWRLLFRTASDESDVPGRNDSLLLKCMAHWSVAHIEQCREWIINEAVTEQNDTDFGPLVLFLLATSGQSTVTEPFSSVQVNPRSNWASTKEFVVAATSIAVQSLVAVSSESPVARVRRDRVPPPGLTLCIMLSQVGRKQFRSVCSVVLSSLSDPSKTKDHPTLEVILLRLYLLFPHWMDLGTAMTRQALVRAAQDSIGIWSEWNCYWDDRMDGWFGVLKQQQQGGLGLSKALIELSRKQPLLILRKLPNITALLFADASPSGNHPRGNSTGPDAFLYASLSKGRSVKVTLRHWGDSFGEPLWLLFLDVIQAIPPEVLYTIVAPLEAWLSLYLDLLFLASPDSTVRWEGRVGEVCGAYRQHNPEQWQAWVARLEEAKHVQVVRFLRTLE